MEYKILYFDDEIFELIPKIQSIKFKSEELLTNLNEVCSFFTNIKGENVEFQPFRTKIKFTQLKDFLFLEDKNGISKSDIGLEIEILFPKDEIKILINIKNDSLIIYSKDKSFAFKLKKILNPYSETSLKDKLQILKLENSDNSFI